MTYLRSHRKSVTESETEIQFPDSSPFPQLYEDFSSLLDLIFWFIFLYSEASGWLQNKIVHMISVNNLLYILMIFSLLTCVLKYFKWCIYYSLNRYIWLMYKDDRVFLINLHIADQFSSERNIIRHRN